MEFTTNELVAVVILLVCCWKLRRVLEDLEREASTQRHRFTNIPDDVICRDGTVAGTLIPAADSPPNETLGCLNDIRRADPSFEANRFVANAASVYEMVIAAFLEGDRQLLKPLLATDVYDTFSREISGREARGERTEFTFIRLKRGEIVSSTIFNGQMEITVRFDSEIVMATRDLTGAVISGDPAQVIEANDLWTFTKERAESPVWKLSATETPPRRETLVAGNVLSAA
jgi:predicted lipid-binding transport protein (Tim44 family)